jgi:hypothetical protein
MFLNKEMRVRQVRNDLPTAIDFSTEVSVLSPMTMNPSRRSRQSSSTTTEDQSLKLQQEAAPNPDLRMLVSGVGQLNPR